MRIHQAIPPASAGRRHPVTQTHEVRTSEANKQLIRDYFDLATRDKQALYGQIVDHWMPTDTLGLMQQIGAVPVAETGQ